MIDPEATHTVTYYVVNSQMDLTFLELGPGASEADAIAFRDEQHPGCSLYKQELWHKCTEVV